MEKGDQGNQEVRPSYNLVLENFWTEVRKEDIRLTGERKGKQTKGERNYKNTSTVNRWNEGQVGGGGGNFPGESTTPKGLNRGFEG